VSRKKPSTGDGSADATDGPAPSTAAPAAATDQHPESLQGMLEEIQRKLAEARSRADGNLALLQRVAADYENFKKFAERERAESVLRERAALLADYIDSRENLERALGAGERELSPDSKLLKGLQMTLELMRSTLERAGVLPIEALGRQFDPSLHEAVYFVQDPSKPEYSITEELRRGYTLNGKVLRTSKVCVVTRPAAENKDGPECPKDDLEE